MRTKRILLERLWDGHQPGEIIEEADFTVDSMVRKGYGRELSKREADKIAKARPKGPAVETADATPSGETADAPPQIEDAGESSPEGSGD